ncbi:MAG: glutamine amidotransferase [Steroidobacteraceae bacterium]
MHWYKEYSPSVPAVLDWLLKYPLADYARGKLIFSSGWPAIAFAAAFVVGFALIAAIAWRRRRALSAWRLSVLLLLQAGMLGLALLALSQPALLLSSLAGGENSVAVLLDDSASMSFQDGGSTRLQQASAVLDSPAFAALARRYRLRDYVFAGAAQAVDGYRLLPAPGDQTAIADSVLQVLRELHTSALGAVIVVSDGADSAGALSDDTLNQIASYGVPVHTIGVGRERMPEDLELADVLVPARALPGTAVAARASIRHDGPGSTRLEVYDGDRFIGSRDVTLPADSELTSVPIDFTLDQAGERELRFTLTPKAGERELRNNTRLRMVDVSEHRADVLYIEGEPRWEYKFMRRALDDDTGVRLASLLRTTPNGYYRQGIDSAAELQGGFPQDRAKLYAYDALIIGSMPAAWFNPEQLQMIRDFVSERGGSLLMLAGPHGLGDGGWADTVVGQILPAQLPTGSFHRVRVPVVLTARGQLAPMLRFADDPATNAKLWSQMPPVADYQDLGALRLAASSLLDIRVAGKEQPLLVSEPYGRGQSMILATGGTWRWRMGLPSADTRHQQFWRQLVRGLVSNVPRQFELSARTQGAQIMIRADLRDAAFRPLSDAAVSATVSSPQEISTLMLQPLADQPGVYQGAYRPEHSGSFVIEASAADAGKPAGTARTSLQYQQGEAEYFSLRQNRALLQRLSAATGARYWRPGQLAQLPAAINASSSGVVLQRVLPLWDAPLLFGLLIALKCGEWLLRRRWGVV